MGVHVCVHANDNDTYFFLACLVTRLEESVTNEADSKLKFLPLKWTLRLYYYWFLAVFVKPLGVSTCGFAGALET